MIEEFYKILNKSVASQETYNRWADYRNDLTVFIADNMWKNGSCIILGAGNLLDIDLLAISKNCSDLILSDIDIEAVNRGFEMQGAVNNISLLQYALGGRAMGNLMKLVTDSIEKKDIVGLKLCLDSYKFTSEFEIINYDNVMVSAVYTQLFIPQFLVICEKYQLEASIKNLMLEEALIFTSKLISHVNDEIMILAADDASVVIWSDVLEYTNGSPALMDIKNHIDDFEWMEEFYQTYIRDYGHGLGSFGIMDISDRIEIIGEKWLIWPFNENRTLVVKAISGRVTS